MQKKVLLTGVTGFIGRNLVKRFLSQNWQVNALIRSGSDVAVLAERGQIQFFNVDKECMTDILARVQPDVVVHLASLYLAQHDYKDIPALINSNVAFGTNLLDAMRLTGVKNFINTGTAWQHYQNEDYNPVNLYAATKQAFEAIIKYYQEAYNFRVINLQLFDTYGRGDTRRKIVALLDELRQTNHFLAMSQGEQFIDLVHIDDVVNAFIMAADYLLQGSLKCGTYAVSSQQPIRLKDLVAEYERIMNCKLHIEWGGRPYRSREVMIPWSDYMLLPGWRAEINFEDGIRRI